MLTTFLCIWNYFKIRYVHITVMQDYAESGMVAYAFNFSTWEAGAGDLWRPAWLSSRPAKGVTQGKTQEQEEQEKEEPFSTNTNTFFFQIFCKAILTFTAKQSNNNKPTYFL